MAGLDLHHSIFSLPESPESPGAEMDYPIFISIDDWLDSIKMSQYKSNFMAAGCNTLDSVARMSIEWVSVCLLILTRTRKQIEIKYDLFCPWGVQVAYQER